MLLDFLAFWCVQEVAGLKEEDLSTEIHSPTANSGDDPSSILSESQYTHVHKLFNVTVVLLYTGIADLAQVKRFLKNMSDWFTLGLELGLLFPTLKKIDEEKHGDIERRKTEMLAAWLQQQDNVSQVGAPSWSVLRQALRNIGENELAKSKITTK